MRSGDPSGAGERAGEGAGLAEIDHIEMLAEVRMNGTGDSYDVALSEVRAMVADGAHYDDARGWVWGNET